MKRLLPCLLLLLAAALAACGPTRKSVFPPTVTIQQLVVQPGGQWRLTLRIQNNSYAGMDFTAIDGQLQIADQVPLRVHQAFDRDIPALAGDTIDARCAAHRGDGAGAGRIRRQRQRRRPCLPPERQRDGAAGAGEIAAQLRLQRHRLAVAGARHRPHLALIHFTRGNPMTAYKAPLDDLRFVLFDVLDAESTLTGLRDGDEHTRDISTRCSRSRPLQRAGAGADQRASRRRRLPLRQGHADGDHAAGLPRGVSGTSSTAAGPA